MFARRDPQPSSHCRISRELGQCCRESFPVALGDQTSGGRRDDVRDTPNGSSDGRAPRGGCLNQRDGRPFVVRGEDGYVCRRRDAVEVISEAKEMHDSSQPESGGPSFKFPPLLAVPNNGESNLRPLAKGAS